MPSTSPTDAHPSYLQHIPSASPTDAYNSIISNSSQSALKLLAQQKHSLKGQVQCCTK